MQPLERLRRRQIGHERRYESTDCPLHPIRRSLSPL